MIKFLSSFFFLLIFTLSFSKSIDLTTSNESIDKISILWNSSSYMSDKDLEKELDVLTSYFKHIKNAEVRLFVFSNNIEIKKEYTINNGNSGDLIDYLTKVDYDGSYKFPYSCFDGWADRYFLFTSGVEIKPDTYKHIDNELIILTSSINVDKEKINNLAYRKMGFFFDLLDKSTTEVIEGVSDYKIVTSKYKNANDVSSEFPVKVYCYASEDEQILKNVQISRNGKPSRYILNDDGLFIINANIGDELIFDQYGRESKNIKIVDKRRFNIFLSLQGEELDEVVLNSEKKDISDEKTVVTAFGKVDKRRLGYTVESIDGKDVSIAARTLGEYILGKFSGIQLTQTGGIKIRNNSSIEGYTNVYPLFILDGVPLERSNTLASYNNVVEVDDILNITLLKSLAATARYGNEGSSGVFLITTKTGTASGLKKNISTKTEELSQLEKYNGHLKLDSIINKTVYNKALFSTLGKPDYKKFILNRNKYQDKPYFFIEASEFFYKQGDVFEANKILSNVLVFNKKNIPILKVAGFIYRERSEHIYAFEVYNQIFKTSNNEAQSYLDYTKALGNVKKYQEAIGTYKKILDGSINKKIHFDGLRNQVVFNYKKLLTKRDGSWDLKGISKTYFTPLKNNIKVELEWSGYDDRFKLIVVSPDQKLLSWDHSYAINNQEIEEELISGITSKSLNFDLNGGNNSGNYYFGLENIPLSTNVSYIYINVYINYGKPDEKKTSKLVKLTPENNNLFFVKI